MSSYHVIPQASHRYSALMFTCPADFVLARHGDITPYPEPSALLSLVDSLVSPP
jgi:hypothetical protein